MSTSVMPPNILRWFRLSAVWATLLVCFIGIIFLTRQILEQFDHLDDARIYNSHWQITQFEVDYLNYLISIEQVSHDPSVAIDTIRNNFSIFEGRVKLVADLPQIEMLKNSDEFVRRFQSLQNYIAKTLAQFAESDDTVRQSVYMLMDSAAEYRQEIHDLSVLGLKLSLEDAYKERQDISKTFKQLIGLSIILFVIIAFIAFIMLRLYRTSETRAMDHRKVLRRMSTVISSSLEAILVVDKNGFIEEYNGAAEKIFGFSAKEAIGAKLSELIIPEKHQKAHEMGMKRILENGAARVIGRGRVKVDGMRKGGSTFPVEMSLDVIKDKEETLFVSFMRDISDEIKAEEELIQSRNRALVGERAKAEFLTTISHEIRTPMNGLMGMIDLLKETKTTEKQRKYIDSMSDSGSSLLQHVNNVLEITKYDSGQTVVEPEEFDLNDLVTEVLQLQSMIAKKSGNTMHHRWDGPQTGILKGDKEKLQKILFSLVDNANKFSQNSDVTIQTSAVAMEQGQICVRLAVIDNGIGIERSDFERIFEDFTTLDGSYRRVAEGAGLGLGVAQRFAIAIGGEISVESKIGSGSTFAVKVPLTHISDSPIERDPAQTQNQSGMRGLRILMVEDNEINRIVLRETLTQNGHQVVEAGDGETGVKLSEAEAFDVVLMDISMPMMDGVEATDHIRRGQGLSSKAPIFAITAHCTPNEIKKFKKAGINAVLSKPIKKSQLFTKLKEVGIMRREEIGTVQGERGVLDMSTDIIDLEKIAELKDQLGIDVLKTLLDRFVNETEEMIEGLCAPSALDSDVADLIKAIHKVAGSSAALGATEMRKTLNQLEMLGKESDTPTVVSRVGDLKDIWHISKESLKNHGLLNA